MSKIEIQELDRYTLLSPCLLYIEGKLTKEDGSDFDKFSLINNGFSYLFREISHKVFDEKCRAHLYFEWLFIFEP